MGRSKRCALLVSPEREGGDKGIKYKTIGGEKKR